MNPELKKMSDAAFSLLMKEAYIHTMMLPAMRPVIPVRRRDVVVQITVEWKPAQTFRQWSRRVFAAHEALHTPGNGVARSAKKRGWSWEWMGFTRHPNKQAWIGQFQCRRWEAEKRGESCA